MAFRSKVKKFRKKKAVSASIKWMFVRISARVVAILDMVFGITFLVSAALALENDPWKILKKGKVVSDCFTHILVSLVLAGTIMLYSGFVELKAINKMKAGLGIILNGVKLMAMLLICVYLNFLGEQFQMLMKTKNPPAKILNLVQAPFFIFTLAYPIIVFIIVNCYHGMSRKKNGDPGSRPKINPIKLLKLSEQPPGFDPALVSPQVPSRSSVIDIPEAIINPEALATVVTHPRRAPMKNHRLSMCSIPEIPMGMSARSKSLMDCENTINELQEVQFLSKPVLIPSFLMAPRYADTTDMELPPPPEQRSNYYDDWEDLEDFPPPPQMENQEIEQILGINQAQLEVRIPEAPMMPPVVMNEALLMMADCSEPSREAQVAQVFNEYPVEHFTDADLTMSQPDQQQNANPENHYALVNIVDGPAQARDLRGFVELEVYFGYPAGKDAIHYEEPEPEVIENPEDGNGDINEDAE